MDKWNYALHLVLPEMIPYLDISHYIICCISVRHDFNPANKNRAAMLFSRQHPLSCWISCMLTIFSGSLLARFLLNEPIVGAFQNNQQVVIATAVWYSIFYSPLDIAYRVFNYLPINLVISIMKEVNRCQKLDQGVRIAARVYPNSYFIMILIGTVKGNGSAFLKVIERMIRGIWTPSSNEFLQPTFVTNASIVASMLFVLERKSNILTHQLAYTIVLLLLIQSKLTQILFHVHDPIKPIVDSLCIPLFGDSKLDTISQQNKPNTTNRQQTKRDQPEQPDGQADSRERKKKQS